ncbi:hypothetical protein LB542_29495 [Mesorhizobium sp. BR1-1-9]|uniref:hypothetical protein n=1 Tax=Mesorhizobium sp. BR1-1-9 TaxID=2876646 RepID=UPI001CD09A41|nr:hypothetical protein [Mesorhizobium sp. BR1-1-9]MBZ9874970.1 hypothetical protein [Mesorhizobium sp. BR1-1-9]
MTIYSTGTVSVTNGDAVVTGSGTAWAVALITGGMFSSAGAAIPILSVDSDTQLTLSYAWSGATASGATYAIARENSEAASVIDLNDRLARILVTLSLVGIHPDASGTIADRDALTLTVGDKGFLFLHAEFGLPFLFYRWSGTAWDGPFDTRGAAGVGTGGLGLPTPGATNKFPYYSAASTVVLGDITAFARTLLDDTDASAVYATLGAVPVANIAATLTPDKAFRRGNILGTVAQSGGVPTGAVIEAGSNSNGDYVRFADGTQICRRSIVTVNTTANIEFTSLVSFAAVFSATPNCVISPITTNNTVTGGYWRANSISTVAIEFKSTVNIISTNTFNCVAIGRWF